MKTRYNILCQDHQNIVTGRLRKASEFGAEIALLSQSSDPIFARGSTICLNILDETTGDSMRVQARLARATLENRRWIYIVQWAGLPKIILDPVMTAL